MGTPRAFLDKLKRRGVYRVAGAYVVVGLGVLGAAELILDPLGFGALRPYVVILVLVGLPIAVVLAWAYRLTPETAEDGPPLTPSDAADDAESDNLHPKSRRIDGVRKGIAVLPFVNMSSDPEQEYFSDGISEELLNLLTTVPDLRVVSRSSAFYFKGKDVRAHGRSPATQRPTPFWRGRFGRRRTECASPPSSSTPRPIHIFGRKPSIAHWTTSLPFRTRSQPQSSTS